MLTLLTFQWDKQFNDHLVVFYEQSSGKGVFDTSLHKTAINTFRLRKE